VPLSFDVNPSLCLLARDGTLVNVGVPAKPISLAGFSLLDNRRSIVGTKTGGIPETQEIYALSTDANREGSPLATKIAVGRFKSTARKMGAIRREPSGLPQRITRPDGGDAPQWLFLSFRASVDGLRETRMDSARGWA
jgi:hypothetical protein